MRRIKLLILILIFIPVTSLAQDYYSIYKAFEPEINQKQPVLPFKILKNSYSKLKILGSFIHGTYKITSFTITPLRYHIYKLDLKLTKKKGIFNFSKNITLFFWLGTDKIVFLTPKGKKRFNLPGCEVQLIKNKNGYTIERKKQVVDFNVPVEGGEVHILTETLSNCK